MIDLASLPEPALVSTPDFEAIYQQKLARFQQLYPEHTAALESDAVVKLLELSAYDALLHDARINDAGRATMLAYARGTDLDHRAADYDVQRLLLVPADPAADPPLEAVWESDDRLRLRCQMAFDGLSVAGSRGAYVFHTLSAAAGIADVSVASPQFDAVPVPDSVREQLPAGAFVLACTDSAGLDAPLPGDVAITVLAAADSPQSSAELVERAGRALSAEDVRPLTDRPRVAAGQPLPFRVVASLAIASGPDATLVLQEARTRLDGVVTAARRLGARLSRSALYAALHVPGVVSVDLQQPTVDIHCDARQFPACEGVVLSRGAS